MDLRCNTPPFRVAGIYLSISLTYIVVSDWLADGRAWTNWLPGIQTTKGIVFVLLSAILIHFLITREMRRRQAVQVQLMRAQRMEAVGQLTSGVAHDFNNFLTVILGNLELIQQDAGCSSDLRKRADHALLAAERGADLTRRLLALSRKQGLEPRLVDVSECVTQMKMLLEVVLGEGVEVVTDLAPGLPPITGDPGQLETAVLNLALNARDAMHSGGVISLTASFVKLDADQTAGRWPVVKGEYVVIAVNDDGQGMPERVQERLLEPFFTTKPEGEGHRAWLPDDAWVRQTIRRSCGCQQRGRPWHEREALFSCCDAGRTGVG
ncbi:ATP-binding protein [Pararhodobacter sp. SW119]|uniref:sensor histidine kinase n=1 Tax=Pararhodobacter sp. SW119 TaxID=2780075 RepID=UPI001ADFE4F8|nr:ATP-binding protein [Pararhodobacter sp. SW119]